MLIVDKEATHKQHTRIASPVLFRIELLFKADKIHVSCPPYQFNELLFVRQYYFLQLRHTYASGHCGAEDTKSGKSCIAPFLTIACLEYKNGALSSLGR